MKIAHKGRKNNLKLLKKVNVVALFDFRGTVAI